MTQIQQLSVVKSDAGERLPLWPRFLTSPAVGTLFVFWVGGDKEGVETRRRRPIAWSETECFIASTWHRPIGTSPPEPSSAIARQ